MLINESRKTYYYQHSFTFREIEEIMSKSILVLVIFSALLSCTNSSKKTNSSTVDVEPDSVYVPTYAKQFVIKYFQDYKIVEVNDPWDDAAPKHQIVLSSSSEYLKKNIDAIQVPLKRWVAVASTQISYADKIEGAMDALVGMAEPQYVSNPTVVNGLKTGAVRNIGTAFAPDLELLIDIDPNVMMISPFKEDFYGPIRQAGIKLAMNSSYLENTPLGRVEWLVYVAAFFNKEQEAIDEVHNIAQRYNNVKSLTQELTDKPTVVSGKIYQGVWYAAAAQSYNANYYADAGADYIFKDRPGTGSLSYDFETVYNSGAEADYWVLLVNYNGNYSYEALKDEDVRYKDFDAFKNRKVFFSNTGKSLFYEKGLLEPDVVLSDMVKVFHPNLLPNYTPCYYKMMTKE